MDVSLILLVLCVVFLGSLTRAIFGFGDSVVAMPLLALLPLPLHTSISLIGLMGLTVAIFTVLKGWKKIDRSVLLILSISTLVGIPIGLYLVTAVSQSTVTRILGVFLLFYGVYSLIKQRFHMELPEKIKSSRWLPVPFGFLAGMLGSAYNMNGIPIVVYGTFRDWDMEVFMGTLQTHFVISSSFIILGQALGGLWSPDLYSLYFLSIPVIFFASKVGSTIQKKISVHRFETLLFIFIIFLGGMLFSSSS